MPLGSASSISSARPRYDYSNVDITASDLINRLSFQVKKRSLLAKDEGGLGIRALKDVNMVCGLKLIWG